MSDDPFVVHLSPTNEVLDMKTEEDPRVKHEETAKSLAQLAFLGGETESAIVQDSAQVRGLRDAGLIHFAYGKVKLTTEGLVFLGSYILNQLDPPGDF